jgi:hypothetical protein
MFRRHQVTLMSDPFCNKAITDIQDTDFLYFDKDGFELNQIERKYYAAMNHPINYPILNHTCWQEPWFELESNDLGLILDHSMFLCRCHYTGEAEGQLKELSNKYPLAQQLLSIKTKWGFDFDLNAVSPNGTVYEVIHIEFDSRNYDHFKTNMISFEWTVRHKDWQDIARDIWANRDQWQDLKGFEQNHWKAKHILGWEKAEYLEKAN